MIKVKSLILDWGSQLFHFILSQTHRDLIRSFVVPLSLLSFVVHLLLIFLGKCSFDFAKIGVLSDYCNFVGTNYLSAIYTPFTIILFYEIFELVVILPESVTSFMSKQFQVLSLIILRNVFKDISAIGHLTLNLEDLGQYTSIGLDLGTSLFLFFFVGIFEHIHRKMTWGGSLQWATDDEKKTFIALKKTISAGLLLLLLGMGISFLLHWGVGVLSLDVTSSLQNQLPHDFYHDFYTIMIIVDIFLLIFSLGHGHEYEIIFRNGAFIASTILIRLSLSATRPLNQMLAVSSILVGVLTLLIFSYHLKLRKFDET